MRLSSNKNILKKKIFIIGANARLAKALLNHYKYHEHVLLERELYKNWSHINNRNEISSFFQKNILKDSIIFITSGILNAKEDNKIIDKINFLLPWNIIKSLEGVDVKIVTFGTILENLENTRNAYVKSKIKLSNKIIKLKSELPRVTHFRLHTLYGYDNPSKFMFLGQIFDSIKNNSEFNMSSGHQIREYHHLDDLAISIDFLISKNIQGVSEITAGNGIKLRDLALKIFKEFKLENLLNIGTISVVHKEKFSNDYKKNPHLENIDFRDPIEGVTAYLNSIL